MTKIAVVPIDNRPVCYQLAEQICKLDSKNEIFMPDISLLGSNRRNADIEELLSWLESIKNVDVIVIALDTIAYGGLISSRKNSDDFFEVKSRIERLRNILNNKNAKIFAFSSIMRIANNNVNDEEKEYWSEWGTKIYEYSYNIHKLEKTFGNKNLTSKYNDGIIPVHILKDYIETRKRNFEINKYYIELKQEGIFDTLIFSKDDCSEYGLNVKEADELKEISKGIDGVYIKTGADEIPLSLISRSLNKDKNIKIAPVYTNPDTINKISKYEDIPVKESVESQIEMAGGIVSTKEDCDLVLIVNNFKNEQGELVMNIFEKGYEGNLSLPDKPYFIADILNANGADNSFIEKLFSLDFLKNFYGYSAWNTTGNTLGCAISTALTYFCASSADKNMFYTLQLTRFLDDWAYQSNVRSKIRDDVDNLSNGKIKCEMECFEKILEDKLQNPLPSLQYTFPWNRFFEIQIN